MGFLPDTRLIGYCVSTLCEFFDASTCPTPGTKCLTAPTIDSLTVPVCVPGGTGDVGDPCTVNNDCLPLLGCNTQAGTCHPFCDPTHTCPALTACSSQTAIGLCLPAPDTWTCGDATFAAGDGCHCDCGGNDPDCQDPMQPVISCGTAEACAHGNCVPDAWTCNGNYYDHADGCDCNCGAPDPDCDLPNQNLYGCMPGEQCVAGVCQ